MKPHLLVTNDISGEFVGLLDEAYILHFLVRADDRDAFLNQVAPDVQGVVTSGSAGVDGAVIRALPHLEIICCMSAGYEKVDVATARERSITVTHGVGINAASVADNAICLLLAVVRNLVPAIGLEVARRAAGFGMEISYHNRRPRTDVPYRYCPTLAELAEGADYLVVSCPGGAETFHMVNGEIFAALGPQGVVINVARGPVVHTGELVAALQARAIAGAGLDLVEDEPDLLEKLLAMDNVLITPHISAPTVESQIVMATQLRANLDAHFSGRPVLTPIAGAPDHG